MTATVEDDDLVAHRVPEDVEAMVRFVASERGRVLEQVVGREKESVHGLAEVSGESGGDPRESRPVLPHDCILVSELR